MGKNEYVETLFPLFILSTYKIYMVARGHLYYKCPRTTIFQNAVINFLEDTGKSRKLSSSYVISQMAKYWGVQSTISLSVKSAQKLLKRHQTCRLSSCSLLTKQISKRNFFIPFFCRRLKKWKYFVKSQWKKKIKYVS